MSDQEQETALKSLKEQIERQEQAIRYLAEQLCIVTDRVAGVEKGEPMSREELLKRLEEAKPKTRKEKVLDVAQMIGQSLGADVVILGDNE